jgi:hypothetical protein
MKKKVVSLLLVMMLVLSLVGCGNSKETAKENATQVTQDTTKANESTETASTVEKEEVKPLEIVKIAVAWSSIDASTQIRMTYLQEHLGPAVGIDFIFSEEISDTAQLMTFLENSYAAGADGFLSTVTDGTEQLIAKADELGMYTVVVSSTFNEAMAEISTYMGITGINLTEVAVLIVNY